MWSLGCLIHWLLAQELPISRRELLPYCLGKTSLPHKLEQHHSSREAIEFIKHLMRPKPQERLTAAKALEQGWPKEMSIGVDVDTTNAAQVSRDRKLNSEVMKATALASLKEQPSGSHHWNRAPPYSKADLTPLRDSATHDKSSSNSESAAGQRAKQNAYRATQDQMAHAGQDSRNDTNQQSAAENLIGAAANLDIIDFASVADKEPSPKRTSKPSEADEALAHYHESILAFDRAQTKPANTYKSTAPNVQMHTSSSKEAIVPEEKLSAPLPFDPNSSPTNPILVRQDNIQSKPDEFAAPASLEFISEPKEFAAPASLEFITIVWTKDRIRQQPEIFTLYVDIWNILSPHLFDEGGLEGWTLYTIEGDPAGFATDATTNLPDLDESEAEKRQRLIREKLEIFAESLNLGLTTTLWTKKRIDREPELFTIYVDLWKLRSPQSFEEDNWSSERIKEYPAAFKLYVDKKARGHDSPAGIVDRIKNSDDWIKRDDTVSNYYNYEPKSKASVQDGVYKPLLLATEEERAGLVNRDLPSPLESVAPSKSLEQHKYASKPSEADEALARHHQNITRLQDETRDQLQLGPNIQRDSSLLPKESPVPRRQQSGSVSDSNILSKARADLSKYLARGGERIEWNHGRIPFNPFNLENLSRESILNFLTMEWTKDQIEADPEFFKLYVAVWGIICPSIVEKNSWSPVRILEKPVAFRLDAFKYIPITEGTLTKRGPKKIWAVLCKYIEITNMALTTKLWTRDEIDRQPEKFKLYVDLWRIIRPELFEQEGWSIEQIRQHANAFYVHTRRAQDIHISDVDQEGTRKHDSPADAWNKLQVSDDRNYKIGDNRGLLPIVSASKSPTQDLKKYSMRIKIVSATDLYQKHFYRDLNTYAALIVDGWQRFQTVRKPSKHPIWNEEFEVSVTSESSFKVELW